MNTPFAPGSVSLRLYPHNDLGAVAIVDELRAQAALAEAHGFDGVMTSEHHGGFHGYLPNPLQAAGWCLEATAHAWAAPAPLLLPLRPSALVAEEIAWLAARFPGRAGLLFDSLSRPERCRELIDAYHEAGGSAPCVLIRRAWVGEPLRERVDDQVDVYRSYSSKSAMEHWGSDELVGAPTADDVVNGLLDALERAGADALNL